MTDTAAPTSNIHRTLRILRIHRTHRTHRTDRGASRFAAAWTRSTRTGLMLATLTGATLTGCGSDGGGDGSADALSPADVTQTVEFTASEYTFGADASTMIEAGEVVRFRLTNIGRIDHEMRVLDDTGRFIDQIDRLAPGESGEMLLRFDAAGQYQLICDIDDHLTLGQRAIFSVDEPSGD